MSSREKIRLRLKRQSILAEHAWSRKAPGLIPFGSPTGSCQPRHRSLLGEGEKGWIYRPGAWVSCKEGHPTAPAPSDRSAWGGTRSLHAFRCTKWGFGLV